MGWLSLVLTVISLRERIRSQIRGAVPPVRAVVLDMESVSIIDLEGLDMLKKIAEELEDLEIAFYLCRVKAIIQQTLVKDNVLELIPEERIFVSGVKAMEAALQLMEKSA